LYLDGWITDLLPDLADATLKISGTCPDYWEQEPVKITDFRRLVVRHEDEYGGPLRPLENNVSHSLSNLCMQTFGAIRSTDVVIAGADDGLDRILVVSRGGEMELLGGSDRKTPRRTNSVQLCAEFYTRVPAEPGWSK
jgi:hypothetical protein